MAVDCTPQALVDAAKCLMCIPVGMQLAAQTHLLNVISGLNLTPQQLMDAAKCYRCLEGMHAEAQDYLLCQIVNQ